MLISTFVLEGLAVGVGFGAIGKSKTATFENARLVVETNESEIIILGKVVSSFFGQKRADNSLNFIHLLFVFI